MFQDLDTPQQQIKKLKEILTDLGMTGRMSMEQAKAIKEKRELAQELRTLIFLLDSYLQYLLIEILRGCRGIREQSSGSNFKESEGIF